MTGTDVIGDDVSEGLALAVARVGGCTFGIDVAQVVQVLPKPAAGWLEMPRRAGGLAGVLTHRGQPVPVVRLERWLEVGPSSAPADAAERILMLRDGDRLVGLVVDAVVGVRRLRAGEVRRVHHDVSPDELFERLAPARGDQPAVNVLEADRLIRLAGAWCESVAAEAGEVAGSIDVVDGDRPHGAIVPSPATAGEVAAAAQLPAANPTNPTNATKPADAAWVVATFHVGAAVVGLPVADIGELRIAPPMQRGWPKVGASLGTVAWRGRTIAVIDFARALGTLGRANEKLPPRSPDKTATSIPRPPERPEAAANTGPDAPLLCIVQRGDRVLGLLVHDRGTLRQLDPSRILVRPVESPAAAGEVPAASKAIPPAITPPTAGRLIAATFLEPDDRTLDLIDTDALFAAYPESALTRPPSSATGAAGTPSSRNLEAYIVFAAGPSYAALLTSIEEAVALPDSLLERLDRGLPATFVWRGRAMPVVDLRTRAGHRGMGAPRQLLVVRDGERYGAIAIEGVRTMIPRWSARLGRWPGSVGGIGAVREMLTLEAEGGQVSHAVLPLRALLPEAFAAAA